MSFNIHNIYILQIPEEMTVNGIFYEDYYLRVMDLNLQIEISGNFKQRDWSICGFKTWAIFKLHLQFRNVCSSYICPFNSLRSELWGTKMQWNVVVTKNAITETVVSGKRSWQHGRLHLYLRQTNTVPKHKLQLGQSSLWIKQSWCPHCSPRCNFCQRICVLG